MPLCLIPQFISGLCADVPRYSSPLCASCLSFSPVMRSFSILLFCTFLAVCEVQGAELRVCAFNLHNFGESKAKNSNVMHMLTKVRHPVTGLDCVVISYCLKRSSSFNTWSGTLAVNARLWLSCMMMTSSFSFIYKQPLMKFCQKCLWM